MKKLAILLGIALTLGGCGKTETYPLGTDVTVEKKDGANVAGKLTEVKPQQIVLEARDGAKTEVPKSEIASLKPMTAVAEPPRATGAKPGAPAENPAGAKDGSGSAPPAPVAPEPPRSPQPNDTANAAAPKRIEFRELTVPSGTTQWK